MPSVSSQRTVSDAKDAVLEMPPSFSEWTKVDMLGPGSKVPLPLPSAAWSVRRTHTSACVSGFSGGIPYFNPPPPLDMSRRQTGTKAPWTSPISNSSPRLSAASAHSASVVMFRRAGWHSRNPVSPRVYADRDGVQSTTRRQKQHFMITGVGKCQLFVRGSLMLHNIDPYSLGGKARARGCSPCPEVGSASPSITYRCTRAARRPPSPSGRRAGSARRSPHRHARRRAQGRPRSPGCRARRSPPDLQ